MDALTFLRADHQSVLGMLEVLDGAPQGSGALGSGLDTLVTNLVIAKSRPERSEDNGCGRQCAMHSMTATSWLTKRPPRNRPARCCYNAWRTAARAIPTITMRCGSSSRLA